jgi:hypothetical protein
VIDNLRSRVSHMLDQKLGWNREYGPEDEVFRSLRETANADEVAEVRRNVQLVLDWVSTIARSLEDE